MMLSRNTSFHVTQARIGATVRVIHALKQAKMFTYFICPVLKNNEHYLCKDTQLHAVFWRHYDIYKPICLIT